MVKEHKTKDDSDFWSKKRGIIGSNLRKGVEKREKVLENIDGVRESYDIVTFQINDEIDKMRELERFYKENTRIDINPVLEGSIDTLEYLSDSDARRWSWLENQSNNMRTIIDSFSAATLSSGTMVPSMAVNTYLIAERTAPLIHRFQFTEKLKMSSPLERKKELVEKLRKVDEYLASRLNGAWQTINDASKEDRVSQSATSMREILTALLDRYAPRKEVENVWWFELDHIEKGKVTRKKRIRYAIAGNNKYISEKELEVIIEAVDHTYKEFDKLNKLTHMKEYEFDLINRTKSIIDQCQIHLLKTLELRKLYFRARKRGFLE